MAPFAPADAGRQDQQQQQEEPRHGQGRVRELGQAYLRASNASIQSATMDLEHSVDLEHDDRDTRDWEDEHATEQEVQETSASQIPVITMSAERTSASGYSEGSAGELAGSNSNEFSLLEEQPRPVADADAQSLQSESASLFSSLLTSSKKEEEDDDAPLSVYSRPGDSTDRAYRPSRRPHRVRNPYPSPTHHHHHHHHHALGGEAPLDAKAVEAGNANALVQLDPISRTIAATVAHLILVRFEPWMAETSKTLVEMGNAIKVLEGRGVGSPSDASFRPSADSTTDATSPSRLMTVQRDMQDDLLRVATQLAQQQIQKDLREREIAELQRRSTLLAIPGISGDGAVPGPGQARIETVPKRVGCVRCEGLGFVHDPAAKKKHALAKNVQCKKCLTCGPNGYLHPGSESCRLGNHCLEGCQTCVKCSGAGVIADSAAARVSPTTGWIPTAGLLAAHPDLKSPVGDRPRSGSTSRSRSGSNAASTRSAIDVAAANHQLLQQQEAKENTLQALKRAFSRSNSRRSVTSNNAGSEQNSRAASRAGSRAASRRQSNVDPEAAAAAVAAALADQQHRRQTTVVPQPLLEQIRSSIHRASRSSFHEATSGSLAPSSQSTSTLPDPTTASSNPHMRKRSIGQRSGLSRSGSARSFVYESDGNDSAVNPGNAGTLGVGIGYVKQPVAAGSHNTLGRAGSNLEVEQVQELQQQEV
ncbi:hypothetical protein HK101_009073 [Irineochytrium annulatum]|nr:hypothetical protein HK101_009073 [Irineochytrium annulatum]